MRPLFGPILVLVTATASVFALANRADAAIIINSASNSASNYGSFDYFYDGNLYSYQPYGSSPSNNNVNGGATVYNQYDGGTGYPYLYSYGSGSNSTNSTTINVQSEAQSYSNPTSQLGYSAYNSTSSQSYVFFTLTTESTATLYLAAYAYTDDPGAFGYNAANANAYLYDYTSGAYYQLVADSNNGSASQNYYQTFGLTLAAGDYRIGYSSANTYGFSYSGTYVTGGSDNNAYAYGTAQLYNIQETVPEPASLAIWGGLGLAGLIAARRRKRLAA